MSRPIPPYLRIHVEELPTAAPALESRGEVTRFCEAYERATGWPLRYLPGNPPSDFDRAWSAPVTPGVGAALGLLAIETPADDPPPGALALDRAGDLGRASADLIGRLLRAETALWQREAELAAGVPIAATPSDRHLANRLEAALAGGARALDCHAAGLYLLDSDTTILKLRSAWNLSRKRFADPPRKLATALADLEALLGHAVVLSDTRLYDRWNPPEDFASAVCVPVSSPTTPLGTLWFFSTICRDFDDRQTNIAELTAARIAADLEREMLLSAAHAPAADPHALDDAAAWQRRRLPTVTPLVDGWQVAGWQRGPAGLSAEFYDWWTMPCGALAMAVGDSLTRGLVGGMAATSLREQLRTCSLFLSHPDELLGRISQLLWTSSAGDQFAALGMARVLSGDALSVGTAGPVPALHLTPDGCRLIGTQKPSLGADADLRYETTMMQLAPGELVVLASDGVLEATDAYGRPFGAAGISAALRGRLREPARALSEAASTALEQHAGRATTDQTLAILKRR